MGRHREDQGARRRGRGPGHRGRQGRPHPRHRPARLPARLARRAAPRARPPALRRPHAAGQDHRARQEPQQRRAVTAGPGSRRRRRNSARSSSRTSSRAKSARASFSRSSTSVPSSTSAAWTASSTSPSCPGSTSTTPSSVVTVGDEIEVQVLDVDLDRERISLSLKATQQDPWQEFATAHRVGELVYGRVTKLVPFGAFVQVGEGIEGLVHISEMAAHHVDLPEQVVTPGEELWVKIIDIDLQRRRISLSIKQAAEGGEVAAEYREHFGEHAYDERGQLHRRLRQGRVHAGDRGPGGVGRVRRRARRGGGPGTRSRTLRGRAARSGPLCRITLGPPPRGRWCVPAEAGAAGAADGGAVRGGRRPLRLPARRPAHRRQLHVHPPPDGHRHGPERRHSPRRLVLLHRRRRALGRPELAPGVDLRLGLPPGRLRVGRPRAGVARRLPGVGRRTAGPRRIGATHDAGRHRRRGRGVGLVDAPALALRAHLHGPDDHRGRAPAQSLAPRAHRVAVGERPRLVPPRTGVARRPGGRRGDRLAAPGRGRHGGTSAGSPPAFWPPS